jgi:hypothetical protein
MDCNGRLGRNLLFVFLAVSFIVWQSALSIARAENWPGWRGPRGDGTSHEATVPVQWNGVTGQGIAWKAALPGVGHSSPIVWEDRVFVTSCIEDSNERVLLCLDRRTGAVLWKTTVLKSILESTHQLNSYASGLCFVSRVGRNRGDGEKCGPSPEHQGRQHDCLRL